jgi:hypothetical protein
MDAAGTVNRAYVPSWPILCKLDVILLKHGWQRIWSMQIGTAPEISPKIRIGDWLHSNEVMAGICGRRYTIDKSPDWSIERARSPRRMVVRGDRRPPKVSAPGAVPKLN